MLRTLADLVQKVLELDPARISAPSDMGMRINTDCIRGMGKRDDEFLIILEIDRVLTSEELCAASLASEAGAGEEPERPA